MKSYKTMSMNFHESQSYLTTDENATFWERRTKLERTFIYFSGFLSVLSFCLIIAIAVIASRKIESSESVPSPGAQIYPVCSSDICKETANELLASITTTIDPCEDFFGYVCTGWKKNHPIPAVYGSYGMFDRIDDDLMKQLKETVKNLNQSESNIVHKVFTFYKSCIDNETRNEIGVKPLHDVLNDLGGWPLLGDHLDEKYDWIDALSKTLRKLRFSVIIDFFVDTDSKNTSANIIYLDQPALTVGRNELINASTNERAKEIVDAYKKYIKTTAHLLGSSIDNDTIEKDIDDIIGFETKLAQFSRSKEERRDPDRLYNKKTVLEAQKLVGDSINITSFLKKVLQGIVNVTDDMKVIVQEMEYFVKTADLIKNTDIRVIANYIGWRTVSHYGTDTTQAFREAKLEFSKVKNGVQNMKELDKVCIEDLNQYLYFAVGRLYIDHHFENGTKEDVDDMVIDLREAFEVFLNLVDWMDQSTKIEAKKKLKEMFPLIAYPPWILNDTELETYHKELGDMDLNDYFGNVVATATFIQLKDLMKLNIPFNRTHEWSGSAAVVNAYYNPSANTITFPAGILKFPFYRFGIPLALNYGGIGSVIGHEITHGFDDEGSKYDAFGNLKNWWSTDIRKKFENKSQCFVDQYGNYKEPLTGMNLNGKNTLGENIADNGGIREAFKAYKIHITKYGETINYKLPGLDLTPDQLFFVGFGYVWCSSQRKETLENRVQYDPHSPAPFRVLGSLSNFKEFSEAFSCSKKSKMNPENKCLLW